MPFSFPFSRTIHTCLAFGNLRSRLTALLTSPILTASRCDMRLGESLTCLFPPGSGGLEAGILHAHCFLVAGDGLLGE